MLSGVFLYALSENDNDNTQNTFSHPLNSRPLILDATRTLFRVRLKMKSDIPSLLVQVRINELNSDGGADGGFRCWC